MAGGRIGAADSRPVGRAPFLTDYPGA